jgi:hypothetical protein
MALLRVEILSGLEEASAESNGLVVRLPWVIDVKIKVHLLLLAPFGPLGSHVVRRQLHTDAPLTGRVEDAVPIVIFDDVPAEDPCPECALGRQVGSVEDDDVSDHLHDPHCT